MLHRNLTPGTILVNRDNSPIFIGFERTRIPTDVTVATPASSEEWEDQVAPEIRTQGRGAADHRSDIYSLCSSLGVMFGNGDDHLESEAAELLALGIEKEPRNRASPPELEEGLSELLRESAPAPPPARYWTEGQIVPFGEDCYKIVSTLGSGGVGTTFKIAKLDRESQEELGTYIAKVVHEKETGKGSWTRTAWRTRISIILPCR